VYERVLLLAVALATTGCAGALLPRITSSDIQVHDPTSAARCTVAAGHSEPLVTEWSASSKARLESLLNDTVAGIDSAAIAVQYSGCELKIIDSCRPDAGYDWSRTTIARDAIEIQDSDELYAKLPLGAAGLEAALKRSGKLTVQTTVAGQVKVDRARLNLEATSQDVNCAAATHLIGSVTIGAFKMLAGGQAHASAGATFAGAGAGGATTRAERLLKEAGSDTDCAGTTKEKPHEGCRSPLQLFLIDIPNRMVTSKFVPAGTLTTTVTPTVRAKDPPAKGSTLRTLSYILGGVGLAGLGGGGASYATSVGIQNNITAGTGAFAGGGDITDANNARVLTHNLGVAGLISGGILLGAAVPLYFAGK
jgi:hypothetical protein